MLNAKPPSSFPRCRCKHRVPAPLFTVLGCMMQQKASPANVLAGKHTVPPCGKIQEERRFYPDLLSNSCSHCCHDTITSIINAASILHKTMHLWKTLISLIFQQFGNIILRVTCHWKMLCTHFCMTQIVSRLQCALVINSCRFRQAAGISTSFNSDLFMLPLLVLVSYCRILQTHHFPGSSMM